MKRIQKGFTLIELMIVVAIVGILAAIALPAYQDFVIRSKMSEGLAAMGACKTSVQEFVSANKGDTPTTAVAAGCSTTPSNYVASLAIAGGGAAPSIVSIVMTTRNTGSTLAGVAGPCVLTLISNQSGAFEITSWTPTYAGCDSKFIPSSFR
jgi:type IV pilus assembly protein PilA